MENIRNKVDIKLVNDNRKTEKFIAKPNFKHQTIFDENLVLHKKKRNIQISQNFFSQILIRFVMKLRLMTSSRIFLKMLINNLTGVIFPKTTNRKF